MITNNYDTSSTGLDCELSVSLDGDSARRTIEEDFSILQHSSNRAGFVFFYAGGEDNAAPGNLSECYDFTKATRKEIRAWCIEQYDRAPRDVIEEKRELRDAWAEFAADILDEDLGWNHVQREGLPAIGAALLYSEQDVTGNCQGDYGTIIYDPESFADGVSMRGDFENMVFNAPLYCRLTVDGEEYFLDGDTKDAYSYDKEELVTIATAQGIPAAAVAWFADMLPDYPEYA